jgi:hypothetical protein
MKIPTKEKSELYPLTKSTSGIVHITDSGKFKVAIRPNDYLLPGEKIKVMVHDDDYFEFDTFEDVIAHLLESADKEHKTQFFE